MVADPLAPRHVAEMVADDEELLRRGAPAVRVHVVRERGVSFGVGTPATSPAEAAARAAGLSPVRRSTGGTGVLHLPGDLTWSIVLPRRHPLVGRDFSSAYARLGTGVVMFLAELGLDARWGDPMALSPEYCLLGERGRALTVDGRVLGGAAQHVTATALLHHGIVSVQVDRPLVRRIFGLPEEVAAARLTGLSELGIDRPSERLAPELAAAIAASIGLGRPV